MNGLNLLDLIYLIPFVILIVVGIVLLFTKNAKTLSFMMALGGFAGATFVDLFFVNQDKTVIFDSLKIDNLTIILQLFILVGGFILVLSSKEYVEELEHTNLYYSLISFATVGMLALPAAVDLLTMFIAFELTSISTYALPFIDKREKYRLEAGIKYFLTGAFSTSIILFGMSVLYGLTGSLYINDIAANLDAFSGSFMVLVSFTMILAGLAYKMALVPFHLWAPDTYTGSPSIVSGFLAGITKKGAFAVAFKLLLVAFVAVKLEVTIILAVVSTITMTVGNLAALVQTNVKRMLSFSSVAHAGNILVGFAIATTYALSGALLHIWAHLLMTVGAFLVVLYVERATSGNDYDHFKGLGKKSPVVALFMTIFLLSLSGIPPLLGFWSKMVLTMAGVELGGYYLILAIALVLNSALSLVYYARLIKYMYMEDNPEIVISDKFEVYKLGAYLSGVLLIIFGLLPNGLMEFSISAVENIFG